MIWLPTAGSLSSPLVKIPTLFVSSTLTVLALTPPTRPPSSEEKAKYSGKDKLDSKTLINVATAIYKLLYWGNFVCESAAILAAQFPSPNSEDVLSLLSTSPPRAYHIRSTPTWLAGCALMCLGGGLRLICYRALGRFFTWQLAVKKDHALITHGPYAVVRHPAYLGSAMVGIGTVLVHFGSGSWYRECIGWDTWGSRIFTGLWAGWSFFLVVMLVSRVPTEDAILQKEFGAEWKVWTQKTPYKLIPYVY